MRKQIAHAAVGLKFYAEILAFAPFWKFVVQREPSRRHRVSEGFKQPPQKLFTATTGQNGIAASSGSRTSTNDWRSLLRPANALPKTCGMATLRNEEAT